jgi:hypothetical protein
MMDKRGKEKKLFLPLLPYIRNWSVLYEHGEVNNSGSSSNKLLNGIPGRSDSAQTRTEILGSEPACPAYRQAGGRQGFKRIK